MPRLQGRYANVQSPLSAAGRLREIEIEIQEILRTYPELVALPSNVHSMVRRGRTMEYSRRWRPRHRSSS